jgi:uncharacterized RDD family membrane protein YckC
MYSGGSLFLIAVGAILYWAITYRAPGVDLHMVGLILMVVGLVGLLFALIGEPWLFPGFLSGVLLFIYATVLDSSIGGTVGKLVMSMKSVPISGRMSFAQALMRNVSKVFPVLLLLDWIIGMAVDTRDPRQKWTDQIAHTSVIVYGRSGGT